MGAADRLRRAIAVLRGRPPVPSRADALIESGVLTIGRHTYYPPTVHHYRGDTTRVIIGAFCSIGEGVECITGGNHHPEWVSTFPLRIRFDLPGAFEDGQPASKGDIVVANDVWIGRGAKILSGVTIGDGAVVGAYSVVARDVEPYSIVVGNPARHVRYRFAPDVVQALLEIKWWNWPDEVVLERVSELNGPDVESFVTRHETLP